MLSPKPNGAPHTLHPSPSRMDPAARPGLCFSPESTRPGLPCYDAKPVVSGHVQVSLAEDPSNVQMQAKQLWQAVLSDLEGKISRTQFDNWLRPSIIVEF